MKITRTTGLVVLLVATAAGCVSQGKYDQAVAKTETTRAQLNETTFALDKTSTELEKMRVERERLEALLDEATRSSTSDKTSNEARIAELRKRVDELKAAQLSAENRARIFREVVLRLKEQVESGDLAIVVRDGRMVIQLPNDVLFDTGKTELKPAGQKALTAIAGVMASMSARHFQVAGHTDDVPIHTERFPSNWELSSGRALRVVHFLLDKGVPPELLSAAGYAEMDPLSANASPETRKRNRRTEITLQPEIDEIVKLPVLQ